LSLFIKQLLLILIENVVEPLFNDMRKKIKENSLYKKYVCNIIKGLNLNELEKLFDYILKQYQKEHEDGIIIINYIIIIRI